MICLMDLFFAPNCQNFLLLSKDSMKKSNAKNVDIILTFSGNYAVPISRME